ncbi:MAG TPA: glucose-1-phosphate thymidylyltransferase [Acidimicrobiales bacterium]|jgi:glucose-1-phosphate thymidylyltransferase|nr:glucose-1-phosphate thymidylyltransferase [Acidimicrobiales bacterium]
MKGLILAGGSGRRLRPITHKTAKQLVPIANKPILHYVIEDLVGVGITDLGIVVGDTGKEIEKSVGDGSQWNADITYIRQEEPLGLAHAVLISESFLGQEKFVMYLGDNMFEDSLHEVVEDFEKSSTNARLLLAKVDNPQAFGVAEVDEQGAIKGLVEKPENPKSDLALVGVYLFDPTIHRAVKAIEPSDRGELEITDAIQWMIDEESNIEHRTLKGWWIDTGKKDPLLLCNELILGKIETLLLSQIGETVTLKGEIVAGENVEIIDSNIQGPVVIGSGVKIERSNIGPYVSIGDECKIEDSSVERSVLMEKSYVSGVTQLTKSVLGREVEIDGKETESQESTSVMLGDRTKVNLKNG